MVTDEMIERARQEFRNMMAAEYEAEGSNATASMWRSGRMDYSTEAQFAFRGIDAAMRVVNSK